MINQTDEEKHFGLIDSLKLASSHDRNASFVLIFIFSVSVSVMIGVPIMFKEPLIYCLDSNNNNSTFVCTEVEACSNNYIYYIDKVNGPRSFTTDFELICENSSKKRVALTMNFFGFFVGCFIITFYTISASVRKNVIGFFSFVYGVSLILMLVFSDSLFLISIFLFIASFSFICLNAYIYVFITENFVGDLASSMMILVNIGAASWGMFFAAFAFFVNSNWRLFLGLAGVLMTIGGIYFWVLPFPKRYEKGLENDKNLGIFENFKNMWGQKQILTNFVIFCLIWPLYIVCYTSVLLELESIGGSLYLNMILCSFLEMMAAFLATYLSKFDCGKIIRIILSLLSFFFLLFIFAPVSLSKSSLALTVFFILMMLSGKICYDIICLLVYIYSPKILTDKYVPLFLIFSRFLSRFFNLFIPYINLFFKSFDLHPFVFLGIMWLVSRILISCTKEVQREGISDLINEFKISIFHKLSVLSGGRSMASIPHDEFLKNITIKGQNLSMIKKSRFQSEFGLKDSRQGGISMSLLNNPTFVEYKSKYIAEEKD